MTDPPIAFIPKNLHNIPRAAQIKRNNRKHTSNKE